MSATVPHVVRSERETSEAWIPLLLVHHYNGIISETFQFSCMSASHTPITHLLHSLLYVQPGLPGLENGGLKLWALKEPSNRNS